MKNITKEKISELMWCYLILLISLLLCRITGNRQIVALGFLSIPFIGFIKFVFKKHSKK